MMPHFHGLDMPVFPLTAFSGQTQMADVAVFWASPGITQMGKLRLREAREEDHTLSWSQSLGQTQISGPFSSPFIRGHKQAACGHLCPTDVFWLAQD